MYFVILEMCELIWLILAISFKQFLKKDVKYFFR